MSDNQRDYVLESLKLECLKLAASAVAPGLPQKNTSQVVSAAAEYWAFVAGSPAPFIEHGKKAETA